VLGWSDERSSQAELVRVPAAQLTTKPSAVPWEVAGSLFVAGATAWATVRAVGLGEGDVVVVSAAAGGVGTIAVQLARRAGAQVIGLAGEGNHDWLRDHGVIPVTYGDGVKERIIAAAPAPVTAFIDLAGGPYVELALSLEVEPQRIDTVVDFAAVESHGVKAEGNAQGASAEVMAELAGLVADGSLEVPIAATFPLDQVREAYAQLEQGHTRGKIVLLA
jgi:NADPH:quinone reductase-like Zn-dependent oxidoreductase